MDLNVPAPLTPSLLSREIDALKRRLSEPTRMDAALPDIVTPEFKKWFGDSKVLDAEGKPLVMYHGTAARFTEFDLRKTGQIHYQGRNAFHFISEKSCAENYALNAAGRNREAITMAVYLSLKNPLRFRAIDRYAAIEHYDANISADVFGHIADGHDGVLTRYDGGVFAVVFDPVLIKSATDNRGTFDLNTPDITF